MLVHILSPLVVGDLVQLLVQQILTQEHHLHSIPLRLVVEAAEARHNVVHHHGQQLMDLEAAVQDIQALDRDNHPMQVPEELMVLPLHHQDGATPEGLDLVDLIARAAVVVLVVLERMDHREMVVPV